MSNCHLSNVFVKPIANTMRMSSKNFFYAVDLQPPGIKPLAARPKDPSELNIEDEELANDYRRMYERFAEMEAKLASLNQKNEPEKDIPENDVG